MLVCTTCRTVWSLRTVGGPGGTVVGTAAQVPTQPGASWRKAATAAAGDVATAATAAPAPRARTSRLVDIGPDTSETFEKSASNFRNVEPPIDDVKRVTSINNRVLTGQSMAL
jgi:hypothetical protein